MANISQVTTCGLDYSLQDTTTVLELHSVNDGYSMIPDWSSIMQTGPITATPDVPGYVFAYCGNGDNYHVAFFVNGVDIEGQPVNILLLNTGRASYNTATCLSAFINAGQEYSVSCDGGTAYFVPCKPLTSNV